MSYNCRSVRNKVHEIMDMIKENDADIICLQETWLRKCDSAIIEEIKEYNYNIITERKSRKVDIGGGVAIIYKPFIRIKKIKYKQYLSFESISLSITSQKESFIFTNIYYPGYSPKHRYTYLYFLNELDELLESVLNCGRKNILFGDFNIHMEDSLRNETIKLNEIFAKYSLTQLMKTVTHKLGGIIDLIVCDNDILNKTSPPDVMYDCNDMSDHYPIGLEVFMTPAVRSMKTTVRIQKFCETRIDTLATSINNSENLNRIYIAKNVDEMVNIYNNVIFDICENVSPVEVKQVKERTAQCWFNDDLKVKKLNKRRSERKFVKNKNAANENDYKQKCKMYYDAVRNTRSNYYSNILNNNSKDLKVVYGIVNKLTGDKQASVLPYTVSYADLADRFAEFFSEKINKIRDDITRENTPVHIPSPLQPPVASSTDNQQPAFENFVPLTMSELNKVFQEMKKKNYKNDPIPMRAFSKCFDILGPFLLKIINKSLSEGKFPSEIKHATVTPIVKDKDGDLEDLKNYRPVSNTPTLAKIIEKTALIQLNTYLTAAGLHNDTQSGYKKHHSCETAMIKVVNDIQGVISRNNMAIVLMLDFSAAFDTVDHKLLLDKLKTRVNF